VCLQNPDGDHFRQLTPWDRANLPDCMKVATYWVEDSLDDLAHFISLSQDLMDYLGYASCVAATLTGVAIVACILKYIADLAGYDPNFSGQVRLNVTRTFIHERQEIYYVREQTRIEFQVGVSSPVGPDARLWLTTPGTSTDKACYQEYPYRGPVNCYM
jgi:hypothetical protein